MSEMVEHPQHYGGKDNPHETVKCLEAWGLIENAYLWNAAKYISRAGKKGDRIEDLKKSVWYITREIERLEKERCMHAESNETASPPQKNA